MSTTASGLPVDEYIAKLTERHRVLSDRQLAGPNGRKLKRRLQAQLDKLGKNASQQLSSVDAQLCGLNWLDENQHIVEEALEQIGSGLPAGYLRQLPVVSSSPETAELRIQSIARGIIEHGVLPLDIDWIERFLKIYQRELSLSLGELWALPAYLRIEVLRALSSALADVVTLPESKAGTERKEDLAGRVSGAILSLRFIAATSWRQVVERLSTVERLLGEDPAGAYRQMDTDSRNRYRERVERLARELRVAEPDVCRAALKLSRQTQEDALPRRRHVGYYLTGAGSDSLREAVTDRQSARRHLANVLRVYRSWCYMAAIVLPSIVSLLLLGRLLTSLGLTGVPLLSLLALAAVPLVSVWTETTNWLITQLLPPRVLPKLDFSRGIPADQRTLVAVPCMLTNHDEVARLLAAIEINYLGNDDRSLSYVLLSDFVDADEAETSADQDRLQQAIVGIDQLNDRYERDGLKPFGLMHRRRLWNENAGCWMGWERKRGKLEELNAWLMGADDTSFSVIHGDAAQMRVSRYVITLDADNQLLPGTAGKLIGSLAHPLNRPEFDADGQVLAGYTVIQPRVDLHPVSANRTPFSRMMSGETGIDLYHSAISETYQDLFDQGIYAGKGIYDVKAFSRSLGGRVPTNSVLSHDLLEGVLGRAAFASDIVILEHASPNLAAELNRQHRWIRGDWQLLPWLLPIRSKREQRRGVGVLGRWKLADNLRRSLLPPSLLLLLLAGWVSLPAHASAWTLAVLSIPAISMLLSLINALRRSGHRWGTIRSSLSRLGNNLRRQVVQWLVNLATLPIVAHTALDAIVRTLARVAVTRKRLLEWTPSAQAERATRGTTLVQSYRNFATAPIAGTLAIAIGAVNSPRNVAPIVLGVAWCAAPLIAWLMARARRDEESLTAEAKADLRLLARRTWQFYERFVGPETHWLPPDNYQEAPKLSIADRTSPTNIGLYLLAAVAAHDMRYIGASGLLTRLDGTTETICRLPQFRGHLFNWYNLRDLSVLAPDYVSTVDSGNLLAALYVCRSALQELEDSPLAHVRAPASLLAIVNNIADLVGNSDSAEPIVTLLTKLRRQIVDTQEDVLAWSATARDVDDGYCEQLDAAILELTKEHAAEWNPAKIEEVRRWVIQLRNEADNLRAEMRSLQRWLDVADRDAAEVSIPRIPRTVGQMVASVRSTARSQAPPSAGRGSQDDAQALNQVVNELDLLLEHRDRVVTRIDAIIAQTDFAFLFDYTRKLFHIGYNNTTGELDASYYDLLASEARIASLIAIAKNDVPVSHWLHLGRPLRRLAGMRVVLSWSATAFEYLMPRLFMHTPTDGLLDVSCRAAIREQKRVAERTGRPWGISESAYFDLDSSNHYKYFAFGIESLALRRTTPERHVVAPYASALALPFDPNGVVANLAQMKALGCWGRYGLYDALDFGSERGAKTKPRIVQTFMAHHQAMILAAIANVLNEDSLVRRFHSNPAIASVEHLLHEALPQRAQDRVIRHKQPPRGRSAPIMSADHVSIDSLNMSSFVGAVGNGHLTVRSTAYGGGDISWNGLAITRWQPRTAGVSGGDRIYLTVPDEDKVHTIGVRPEGETVIPEFWNAPHQTELHQRLGNTLVRVATGAAADNDLVFRRVTATNESSTTRSIVLTQYSEIALAASADDQRHPAFNKLFIASEVLPAQKAAIFSRRPRSANEAALYCAVGAVVPAALGATLNIETSRRRFLGRGGSYRRPAALLTNASAEDTGDDGLDPCAALSVELELPPGTTAQIVFLTAVSADRTQALDLLAHYQSIDRVAFAFDQSRRRSAAELTELGVSSEDVTELLKIYGRMLWPNTAFSADSLWDQLRHSVLGTLWSRGISGDYPLCMGQVRESEDAKYAELLLQLQTYLAGRGISIDVALLDESPAGYSEPVSDSIEALVDRYRRPQQRGRVLRLPASSLSPGERLSLQAAAFACFPDTGADDTARRRPSGRYRSLPNFVPMRSPIESTTLDSAQLVCPQLDADNGFGGVEPESCDYVIRTGPDSPTPAPWINVLANSDFGCTISERGASTTWYGNSSEHRLTPWSNDPVADSAGEALYIRDEETGEHWSPMPWPRPGCDEYLVRHTAGSSRFESINHQLTQRVDCFVDQELPVKCWRVRIENTSNRQRRLTVTGYVEWVFGNHFEDTSPYILSHLTNDESALLARNALPRFGNERCAFLTSTEPMHGFTTNRREFLGDLRDLEHPTGLVRIGLSGDIVARSESCAAYQIHLDLQPGQRKELFFSLGAEQNQRAARDLAIRCRDLRFLTERFQSTVDQWRDLLTRVQVQTPDRQLDPLINRWLPYQNLACRIWGRAGLYQAGGGFGFRDQLQDSLALLHTNPELTRQQILKACTVQFPEGDVLHWWHESPTRGVRTRCSDDLLWLPYAVSEYLDCTGDNELLNEELPFLAGETLRPHEGDRYAEFQASDYVASVYDHCRRAIDARAIVGTHGLPLIGSGDWNDGLSNVGTAGRGESAWLAWFLADVCDRFARIAGHRGETQRAVDLAEQRDRLVDALEREAWDGDWYLRGFYDDGTTLGSSHDGECRIDLNAQTWPALTGFGRADRVQQALDSISEHLADDEHRLLKLLAPPFERTLKDPGYIKGYPAGVRENGGQYTHAATWAVWAATAASRPELAMRWLSYLNPLSRVTDKEAAQRYRGEPYVLAGDVYSGSGRSGQAGWTWYTGSAGWLYRIVLEQVLGFQPKANVLAIKPCVPASWQRYNINFRHGNTEYQIEVHDPSEIAANGARYELNGNCVEQILLNDDGSRHSVIVSPASIGAG